MVKYFPTFQKTLTGCLCCEKNVTKLGKKQCPMCGKIMEGNGWDGMHRHWRKEHENVASYEMFWKTLCDEHKGSKSDRPSGPAHENEQSFDLRGSESSQDTI
jgi:hypothetical protein